VPFHRFALTRRGLSGAVIAALLPRPAAAHAILDASDPPARGVVPPGQLLISLRFNSRIDRSRSTLLLTRPDKIRSAIPIDPDGPPDRLTTSAEVGPGAHVIRWQVLAIDGHITRGDLPFTVAGR
jgi:methionine-rich copper-binding protein CopC